MLRPLPVQGYHYCANELSIYYASCPLLKLGNTSPRCAKRVLQSSALYALVSFQAETASFRAVEV
jgi:hypothetical protein